MYPLMFLVVSTWDLGAVLPQERSIVEMKALQGAALLPGVLLAQSVTELYLIQASTGNTLATLTSNARIELPASSYQDGLSIRPNITASSTTAVQFGWDGMNPNVRIETFAPFTLCGDSAGVAVVACPGLTVGRTHTVSVTVYPSRNSRTVSFSLLDATSVPVVSPSSPPFEDIFINCGGPDYQDHEGNIWVSDERYHSGGKTAETTSAIARTTYDPLYQTERWGGIFSYQIPVPPGDYQVTLHFAEIYFATARARRFGLTVENVTVPPFDIAELAGGPFTAVTRDIATLVNDGTLDIAVSKQINFPKLSAIHVQLVSPHLAHSVAGGPYTAVNVDGSGSQGVAVDGSQSHTHGIGLEIQTFAWKLGSQVLGTKERSILFLPIGTHDVTLKIVDTGGNDSIDTTVVTVLPSDYPHISSISPDSGRLAGGETVTIWGSGFSSVQGVQFGRSFLTSNQINVVDSRKIIVKIPPALTAVPAAVAVVSSAGQSNMATFTFVGSTPIEFGVKKLIGFPKPSAVQFAPNGDLYAANLNGELGRFTLDETFTNVVSQTISMVAPGRFIMSIAFDPLETADTAAPTAYITSCVPFHEESRDSTGMAINGKVQAVSGANLDHVVDIITGLPVSDHDHCPNGLEFGDNGELYIQVGGNTNGGIPGKLSGSQKMKENYFSAATLVAHLSRPGFNGTITYNSSVEGAPISGVGPTGLQVYASGMRNPYGIVKHSNGKLYGTDNGPNKGFGAMATGCDSGPPKPDEFEKDKLILIQAESWYGHPNFARAKHDNDPRQCVWNGDGHKAPLIELSSSTDGIIEFQSEHFGGQLRRNLILSKYKDGLFRVILSSDGDRVHPSTNPASFLTGDGGLDVTQAPNGVLVDARLHSDSLFTFEPNEPQTSVMQIKSVFPRKGRIGGGSTLNVYGTNYPRGAISVVVGGKVCNNTERISALHLRCTLPPGDQGSTVDITVIINGVSDTMRGAYRFVNGMP